MGKAIADMSPLFGVAATPDYRVHIAVPGLPTRTLYSYVPEDLIVIAGMCSFSFVGDVTANMERRVRDKWAPWAPGFTNQGDEK